MPLVDELLIFGGDARVIQLEKGLPDIHGIPFLYQNVGNRPGIGGGVPGAVDVQFPDSEVPAVLRLDGHLCPHGVIVIVKGDGENAA